MPRDKENLELKKKTSDWGANLVQRGALENMSPSPHLSHYCPGPVRVLVEREAAIVFAGLVFNHNGLTKQLNYDMPASHQFLSMQSLLKFYQRILFHASYIINAFAE